MHHRVPTGSGRGMVGEIVIHIAVNEVQLGCDKEDGMFQTQRFICYQD